MDLAQVPAKVPCCFFVPLRANDNSLTANSAPQRIRSDQLESVCLLLTTYMQKLIAQRPQTRASITQRPEQKNRPAPPRHFPLSYHNGFNQRSKSCHCLEPEPPRICKTRVNLILACACCMLHPFSPTTLVQPCKVPATVKSDLE